MPQEKTQAEIVAILRAERDYWLQQEDDSSAGIVTGAVGAIANVLAAILVGTEETTAHHRQGAEDKRRRSRRERED